MDRKACADRVQLFPGIHHINGRPAVIGDRGDISANADDRLVHFIGDGPFDAAAFTGAGCPVGTVLQHISVKVDAGSSLLRDKVSHLDELRAVKVPCVKIEHGQEYNDHRDQCRKSPAGPDPPPMLFDLLLIAELPVSLSASRKDASERQDPAPSGFFTFRRPVLIAVPAGFRPGVLSRAASHEKAVIRHAGVCGCAGSALLRSALLICLHTGDLLGLLLLYIFCFYIFSGLTRKLFHFSHLFLNYLQAGNR